MKAPLSWLLSYCDPGLSPEELAEAIVLHSFEVERLERLGVGSTDGFVVGIVRSVADHPDADRLRVCEVDAGDGARTIVCGAPNVAAGQTVPVALPGAVLPDGTKLKQAKLRGIESNGMILSETELEMGEDSDGIIVLDSTTAPGTPLAEVLPIADTVLELDVTSNRVDCFGVYGVAREVHAITAAELAEPPWSGDTEATGEGEGEVDDHASVSVEDPDLCPRFTARVFTDVTIGPSPLWLRARLLAAGQRPINNVVDITNYVMLMIAQPLHAFDLDEVPGGALTVRTAAEGETMTTLDGVERRFDAETVLVCDASGPSGIAGIMGGAASEVSDATTRVLLEVACWDGVNILRSSRKLGLRTEASNRFEKQLHPALAMRGQQIASKLMVDLCGARLVPGTIDVAAEIPPAHRLTLADGSADALLGMPIDRGLAKAYLGRLDFEVSETNGGLEAVVPHHRHYDVAREVDLIEEAGRIHGYAAHLPATLPATGTQIGRLTREQALRRRVEDAIRDLGFDGIVTLSLTDPGMPSRLRIPDGDLRAMPIRISNPLSIEHSELRTVLAGTLLEAAAYNLAHGADGVALSEVGRVYLPTGEAGASPLGGRFVGGRPAPACEPQRLAALVSGALQAGWRGGGEASDFFAVKGVLEALALQLGVEVAVEAADEPFLHPGRAGRVTLADSPIGWIGEIHPLVCRDFDLDAATGFEIDLDPIVSASPLGAERYEDVISYPAVHEDIAVVVPDEIEAAMVRSAVMAAAGELLRSAEIFDVYRGEQVGEGRKSLALRLEFRAVDRTLTDAEVAERRAAIRTAIAEIDGTFRE